MKIFILIFIFLLVSCTGQNDPKVLFEKGEYEMAYRLWQPLAQKGDLVAENYIGIHHYLGLGVPRNYKLAKEWFEKAALNGFTDAQYNLGVMYENGEFVAKDYMTAYMWFYLSNEHGNTKAARRMQALAEEHKLFPNQIRRAQELANRQF